MFDPKESAWNPKVIGKYDTYISVNILNLLLGEVTVFYAIRTELVIPLLSQVTQGLKSYCWSDSELLFQNSKFRIWIFSKPTIYLISKYEFNDVLALDRTSFCLSFYLHSVWVYTNYIIGTQLVPPLFFQLSDLQILEKNKSNYKRRFHSVKKYLMFCWL